MFKETLEKFENVKVVDLVKLGMKADAANDIFTALEKQIPKQPVGDLHSVPHFRCPSCNGSVKTYYDSMPVPFCPWCGQAIYWGKERRE